MNEENDIRQSESIAPVRVQRVVRVLCWIPLIGMAAECYHTVRWSNYQSNPQCPWRYWGSSVIHIIGGLAVIWKAL